jgi:hypothetical protein
MELLISAALFGVFSVLALLVPDVLPILFGALALVTIAAAVVWAFLGPKRGGP